VCSFFYGWGAPIVADRTALEVRTLKRDTSFVPELPGSLSTASRVNTVFCCVSTEIALSLHTPGNDFGEWTCGFSRLKFVL